MQFGLGQIGSNVAGSLGYLKYAIYIIPAIIIIFFVYLFFTRNKVSKSGQNLAIIYSIRHRTISDVKPFVVLRKYDKVKNIEETKAIFPLDQKQGQKQGVGGLLQFFKSLLSRPSKGLDEEEEGAIFSEAIAVFNKAKRGWLTVYSLETYTQLPLVSGSYDISAKMLEMERNIERRVSKLKTSQLDVKNLMVATSPINTFGKLLIVSAVLVFIGALGIAYSVNALSTSLGNVGQLLTALKGTTVLPTGGIILLRPWKRRK